LRFPSLPDSLTARITRYAGHLVLLALMLAAVLISDAKMPRPAFSATSGTAASVAPLQSAASDPLGVPFSLRQTNVALLRPQRSASTLAVTTLASLDARVFRQAVPFTIIPERLNRTIVTYTVQANDTPITVAEQFNLKPETILWCNADLDKNPELLQVGWVLYIPPVDGACHVIQEGDTLEGIAEKYTAQVADIVAYEGNYLEGPPYTLTPGVRLVIPNGEMEYLVWTVPPQPPPRGQTATGSFVPAGQFYTGPKAGVGLGNFIWPVSAGRISQYYWAYHRGIDLPMPKGTPIIAADGGTVIFAGWSNVGYGYLVVIDHGNGFTTWYAHQSQYLPDNGDIVSQGQLIGYVGSTGRSTGPHLHFEIRYNGVPYNPLSYLP
jgi:LysM repeat protein